MILTKTNIVAIILGTILFFTAKHFINEYIHTKHKKEYKTLNFYGKVDSICLAEKGNLRVLVNGKWLYIMPNWYLPTNYLPTNR